MRQSALFLETCKAYYGTARQSTESNLQCMVLHTVQVLVKTLLVLLKFRRWIKLNDDDDDGTRQFGYMYEILTHICKGTIHKHVNISAIMVTWLRHPFTFKDFKRELQRV